MILSRKAKEAIKTALAMAIAYAIALQMGWDKKRKGQVLQCNSGAIHSDVLLQDLTPIDRVFNYREIISWSVSAICRRSCRSEYGGIGPGRAGRGCCGPLMIQGDSYARAVAEPMA